MGRRSFDVGSCADHLRQYIIAALGDVVDGWDEAGICEAPILRSNRSRGAPNGRNWMIGVNGAPFCTEPGRWPIPGAAAAGWVHVRS